jgi:hypothetical protein
MNHRSATIRASSFGHREKLCKLGATGDPKQIKQLDFSQDLAVDQDSTKGFGLSKNLRAGRFGDQIEFQPNDAILNHFVDTIRTQEYLTAVVHLIRLRPEHPNVYLIPVELFDRNGHVAGVI